MHQIPVMPSNSYIKFICSPIRVVYSHGTVFACSLCFAMHIQVKHYVHSERVIRDLVDFVICFYFFLFFVFFFKLTKVHRFTFIQFQFWRLRARLYVQCNVCMCERSQFFNKMYNFHFKYNFKG